MESWNSQLERNKSAVGMCVSLASSSSSPGVGHYELGGMSALFSTEQHHAPLSSQNSMPMETIDIKPIITQHIGQDDKQSGGVGRGNGGAQKCFVCTTE